ncbi:hypothetical protein [Zavarzinia sp.]|uniref:hypothetical protein n=1 Tax=Zavarzinia sp. TaxID=2027920 RepID=UPI003565F3CC
MRAAVLALCLAAAALPAWGETVRVDGPASAAIATGEPAGLDLVSRRFERRALFSADGSETPYLIEIETVSRTPLAMGDEADLPAAHRVTLRGVTAAGIGPVLGQLEVAANAVKVERMPLLEAETWGCCVQANTIRSFDLLTGKFVAAASSDLPVITATALGDAAKGRPAIGFEVRTYKTIDPAADLIFGDDPAALGLITLMREDKAVQQIRLAVAGGSADISEEVDWNVTIGWQAGAKGALSDHVVIAPGDKAAPSYVWAIDARNRVVIPFVDGHFDLARARVPSRLSLTEKPLP